jgi:uncharacterized protein (DUF1330 family)
MSVYLIVNASVTNADSLTAYLSAVGDTLENRDIDVLVSTRAAETIEGQPAGPRVVVMRFPDRDAFRSWYDSAEYQAIVGLRLDGTEGFAVLADGRESR